MKCDQSSYIPGGILRLQLNTPGRTHEQLHEIEIQITKCFEGSVGDGFTCSATTQIRVLSDSRGLQRTGNEYIMKAFDPFEASTSRKAYDLPPKISTEGRKAVATMLDNNQFRDFGVWYTSRIESAMISSSMSAFFQSVLDRQPITHGDIVSACWDRPVERDQLIKDGLMCDWTLGNQEATVYMAMLHAYRQELWAFGMVSSDAPAHFFPELIDTGTIRVPIYDTCCTKDCSRSGQTLDIPIIIMSKITGRTVDDLLKNHDDPTTAQSLESAQYLMPHDEQELSALFKETQALVFCLYAKGLTHIDLRSDNVIISRPNNNSPPHVTLIDMGSIRPIENFYLFPEPKTDKLSGTLCSQLRTPIDDHELRYELDDMEETAYNLLCLWLSKKPRINEIRESHESRRFRFLRTVEDTISWRILMEDVFYYRVHEKHCDPYGLANALRETREIMDRYIHSHGLGSWVTFAIHDICSSVLSIQYSQRIMNRFRNAQARALVMCEDLLAFDDDACTAPLLISLDTAGDTLVEGRIFIREKPDPKLSSLKPVRFINSTWWNNQGLTSDIYI